MSKGISALDSPPESMTVPTLKRELGVRDLALFAIACIVSTRWISIAAHAGSGYVLLWLLAVIFYVVPLAAAVSTLVAKYPEAGGLYLWARRDFGAWHGFLCFWVSAWLIYGWRKPVAT